jgi:membrane protein
MPKAASHKDHSLGHSDPAAQRIWNLVASSPLHSLWDLEGVPLSVVFKRTVHSFNEDNLLSRAAELGYYFLFALFPTLFSATALLGLVARSASDVYLNLLRYLALVVPRDAFALVLDTFHQTAVHASSGKITFGLAAAIWSASVGFSAIQDTMNTVYKVRETRPFWKARASAILVTFLLSVLVTLALACMLLGTFLAHGVRAHVANARVGLGFGIGIHLVIDLITIGLLVLLFAVIYYFAPDIQHKRWRWLTPGAAIGIAGWLLASFGLRLYLYYSDTYTVTYGSLGAVIILLTWFYLTGLMLLLGAEINAVIESAVAERKLAASRVVASPVVRPEGTTNADSLRE